MTDHHVQCTDLFRTMEEGRGLKGGAGKGEGILGRQQEGQEGCE